LNNLVFNNTAKLLRAALYGDYGGEYKPVAVDENGLFLFSPLSVITVTASNFDIRDLNYATDSVTVTATDFDIRNLTGARDSVAVSSMGFVEATVTQTVASGTSYLLAQDISAYSQNSYFIRNNSGGTVTVSVQVAPLNNNAYFLNHTSPAGVSSGNNYIAAVTVPARFARLSVAAGSNTNVTVYYNGRA